MDMDIQLCHMHLYILHSAAELNIQLLQLGRVFGEDLHKTFKVSLHKYRQFYFIT